MIFLLMVYHVQNSGKVSSKDFDRFLLHIFYRKNEEIAREIRM